MAAMRTHQQQIQAEPDRPVTLADQDVSALIGLLAVVEGEVLAGQTSSNLARRLSRHLALNGLLAPDTDQHGLARALGEMNQRLRVARGEYDGVP
jgi:hypothetical protein